MTTPHIDQVRQSLLDTLADLRNKETPMDIERAKAVASVASVLVDTARVENEYLKITGQDKSKFLETAPDDALGIPRIAGPSAHNPFPNVTRHRLDA
ncbi:hypothetical protein [Rhodoferax sp. TH121]|uniref:hypothetical protein n=1 Tax=Rhodoferax sp. TH121 TaxID=2022803 RepID=UPI0015961FA9|nr:hypothetical protein [Rhodoferax sp. TH121]